MPRGTYALAGGGTEEFSCAAGPAGWRYVSGTLDLTLDTAGRQLRVELRSRDWVLRGGVTGPHARWIRTPAGEPPDPPAEAAGFAGGSPGLLAERVAEAAGFAGGSPGLLAERVAEAAGFAGGSPGLLVAAARALALAPGGRARLRLVAVSGDALAARVVEQGWELADVTPRGPLSVARYRVAALDTGEVGEVHLAGDVVLAAPGVELTALSSPPG